MSNETDKATAYTLAGAELRSSDGRSVALICGEKADAETILVRLNAHDSLAESLKDCADFMGSVAGTERVSDSFKAALRTARAALAKAAQ